MANNFDLQVHSSASDGVCSPAEVLKLAQERNISVISLTDHDTIGGLEEIVSAGQNSGMEIIPGIEFSVEEHGAHILGYGLDWRHKKLLEKLEEARLGRIEGAKKIVENLQKAGLVISWEDVLQEAASGVVARPHISRAVLKQTENREKLGGISTVHDFIEKFLTDDNPNYVRRTHLSAKEAVGLIKESGGAAVWSHPAVHFPRDYEGLENFLRELLEFGLRGLEVFTSAHTEDDVEFVQNLTLTYNLLRTAGSDFHEPGQHAADENGRHQADFVGDYPTYGFDVSDVVEKLKEEMGKSGKI